MNEKLKQHLRAAWNKLSVQLRTAILQKQYRTSVSDAVRDWGLSEEIVAALQEEVLLVLLSVQSLEEFDENVHALEGLSDEQKRNVVATINRTLFTPLRSDTKTPQNTQHDSSREVLGAPLANKDVSERLQKLPKSIAESIGSERTTDSFVSISKKHNLTEQQVRLLRENILRAAVGLQKTDDYKVNVTREAHLDPQKLDLIFQDVEQQIFKPVRDALVRAVQEKKQGADVYREPVEK